MNEWQVLQNVIMEKNIKQRAQKCKYLSLGQTNHEGTSKVFMSAAITLMEDVFHPFYFYTKRNLIRLFSIYSQCLLKYIWFDADQLIISLL